jgi:hypothetical protein
VPVPPLDDDVRRQNLVAAGVARRVRADWKSRLAQGEASLPELLAAARMDPVLGAMRVADALGALPGLGPKGVERAMVDCSIASTRRLRGLGVRQQAALLARFPAGAGH